jgi:hypothetical protein
MMHADGDEEVAVEEVAVEAEVADKVMQGQREREHGKIKIKRVEGTMVGRGGMIRRWLELVLAWGRPRRSWNIRKGGEM